MANARFNYGKLRFFDKNGIEIMLKKTNTIKFDIINDRYPSCDAQFSLILSDADNRLNSYIAQDRIGMRFEAPNPSYDIHVRRTISNNVSTFDVSSDDPILQFDSSYSTSNGVEYSPTFTYNDSPDASKGAFLDRMGIRDGTVSYPSMTFEGNLVFDRVSTELVETQSIFILVEAPGQFGTNIDTNRLVDVATYANLGIDDAASYINRYRLFFFIDCRDQKDFRFFSVNGDEVVWSDRKIVDFRRGRDYGSDNGFRVDIGFSGEQEGVYDQKLYVCIQDTETDDITVVGSLNMTAETEGEDERYRALFANFGIPAPEETESAFSDFDIYEGKPDYVSINRHSKKMFLSYSEIFPYVGTYKALVNAVKFLGYDDIFFKEWYKDLGQETPNDDGYIAFTVSFKNDDKAKTINSKPIEERIHLRKMKWISMMYSINKEVEGRVDDHGFPSVIGTVNYYNTGTIAKLMSLKDWLDKYILGVNCIITDVGGEGITFERYNLIKYGQYQQVFDYTNEKSLSATFKNTVAPMLDGSANITVTVNTGNSAATIEEMRGQRFVDLCNGYFDSDSYFRILPASEMTDNSTNIYFGRTLELHNNMDTVNLRVAGELDSFKFNTPEFIHQDYPEIIVDNNTMIIDPADILKHGRTSVFDSLPVITMTEGRIRRYKKNEECRGELAYDSSIYIDASNCTIINVNNIEDSSISSYQISGGISLIPPSFDEADSSILLYTKFDTSCKVQIEKTYDAPDVSNPNKIDNRTYGLKYTVDTFNGDPTFRITGYECSEIYTKCGVSFPKIKDYTDTNHTGYEYDIDILNGSMIFNDKVNDRKIYVDFTFDGNNRRIFVYSFQNKKGSTLYTYRISDNATVNRFTRNERYERFASEYRHFNYDWINLQNDIDVSVLNSGNYAVDAIMSDEYNNLFCARANGFVSVITTDIDASTFTRDSSTDGIIGIDCSITDASNIGKMMKYEDFRCLYEFVPKLNVSQRSDSSYFVDLAGINPRSTDGSMKDIVMMYRNDSSFLYSQFTNTTNRVEYAGECSIIDISDVSVFSFVRKSFYYNEIGTVGLDIWNDTSVDTGTSTVKDAINTYREWTDSFVEGSKADVVLVAYDDLCEYPLYAYPAISVPTKNTTNILDEYHVVFNESVSEDERNEFLDCIKKPSVSTYIIPAWSLKCVLRDGSVSDLESSTYPFSKNIRKNDTYKMIFVNEHDYNGLRPIICNGYGQSSFQVDGFERNTGDDRDVSIMTDSSFVTQYDPSLGYVLFVGHSARDFSEFITRMSTEQSNYIAGRMFMENTAINRDDSYYIDTTYTASLRNFHVRNGISMWNDVSINLNDSSYYTYNCPISVSDGTAYVIPMLSEAFPNYGYPPSYLVFYNNCTIKWKVFRQNGNYDRTLLLECFNHVLPLKLSEKGTYDIDLTVYDRHGNKYHKYMDGAITIK